MKKIILFVFMSLFVATVTAQNHKVDFRDGRKYTFMNRANQFMDETRKHAFEYRSEDWEYSFNEYQKMTKEYQDISSELEDEERSAFLKLKGEYVGLATKAGANNIVNGAKKLIKDISPFFDGSLESLKGVNDSLDNPLKSDSII